MTTKTILAALIAMSFAAKASAQKLDCTAPQDTVSQNACAEKDLEAADAALNAAYKKALASIAKSDQSAPYDQKSWEAALRSSQRAWVAFRDADCKGDVPFLWSGGTGTTAAVLGCMTTKTKTRTEELNERYEAP
jgi:uncharacterized protein YecT (DUF1311 family)